MDEPHFRQILAVLCTIGALGLYFLLPPGRGTSPVWIKRTGAVVAGLSLVLLTVLCGGSAEWRPQSKLDSWLSGGLFTLLSLGSVGFAVLVISSRQPLQAIRFFAALLACNSGLFLFHDALSLAFCTLLSAGGLLGFVYWNQTRSAQDRWRPKPVDAGCEPFMACLTGALLAITFAGTIRYALAAEAHRDAGRQSLSATPLSALPSFHTIKTKDHVEPEVVPAIEILGILAAAMTITAILLIRQEPSDADAATRSEPVPEAQWNRPTD